MTEKLTAQSANRPHEHCGHLMPALVAGERTECVLRPGHSGSHADDRGGRWRYDPHYHLAPAGLREQIAAALEDYPADHWTPSDVAGWIMPTVAAAFDQYREQVANNAEQPPRTTPNNPAAALELDVDVLHRKLLAAKRAARHIGAWGVLQAIDEASASRTTPDNPATSSDTADNPLREQVQASIESEVYEFRERTMWWPEGGITQEIARLATRGAMEIRDRELEQLRAKVAEFDHIINWHTTCASCARILDSAYQETMRAEKAEQQRDRLAGVLSEVLAAFVHKVDGYRIPRRSAEADVVTLDKWRSALDQTQEVP